jgi:hypothetical protein
VAAQRAEPTRHWSQGLQPDPPGTLTEPPPRATDTGGKSRTLAETSNIRKSSKIETIATPTDAARSAAPRRRRGGAAAGVATFSSFVIFKFSIAAQRISAILHGYPPPGGKGGSVSVPRGTDRTHLHGTLGARLLSTSEANQKKTKPDAEAGSVSLEHSCCTSLGDTTLLPASLSTFRTSTRLRAGYPGALPGTPEVPRGIPGYSEVPRGTPGYPGLVLRGVDL